MNALAASHRDPVSGQPELKCNAVAARRFEAAWYGFAVTAGAPEPAADYWASAAVAGGRRIEMAGVRAPEDWPVFARAILGSDELVSYRDERGGLFRFASVRDGRLSGALFVSPEPVEAARGWLVAQLGAPLKGADALRLLAGRGGGADCGSVVCACNNVGKTAILAAIAAGAANVNSIGKATNAGTGCGSCRPEIQALFGARLLQAAE